MTSRLSILALLGLALFVNAVRPITRVEMPNGLRRMTLLSEAATDDHLAVPQPAITHTRLTIPPLIEGAPRLFKVRQISLQSLPSFHLKLPLARSSTDSPAAH